jgi:16S rRNA (guanine1207-N2)-methyltransferase
MDRTDPAERLLEAVPVERGARLLALDCGDGRFLERYAEVTPSLLCLNDDIRDHGAASARLEAGGRPGSRCQLGDLPRAIPRQGAGAEEDWPGAIELPAESFDQVVYRLGKGTAVLHGAVTESWRLLREGGSLFIAGHTREGIKSLAKRAEGHFGNQEQLGMKSSCRLLRYEKRTSLGPGPIPDPGYFAAVPLELELPGHGSIPYLSKPGLFSYRTTDAGTGLLARHLAPMPGLRVLDLGCGSGVLSLAAFRLGAVHVTATDSSAAAVSVAIRNLKNAGVPGDVRCSDLAGDIAGPFDVIISNPPFHQGVETDYGLPSRVLDAARARLAPGGKLYLVANQFLDYPAQAASRFQDCATLARESGFKAYRFTV